MNALELSALVGFIALSATRKRAAKQVTTVATPPIEVIESPETEETKKAPTPLVVPSDWRRMKSTEVTGAHAGFARAALKNVGEPGQLQLSTIDGRQVAAWTEWHYHEPGGPVKPWGWHRGITLLVRKD